jgi:hypothetical protein
MALAARVCWESRDTYIDNAIMCARLFVQTVWLFSNLDNVELRKKRI